MRTVTALRTQDSSTPENVLGGTLLTGRRTRSMTIGLILLLFVDGVTGAVSGSRTTDALVGVAVLAVLSAVQLVHSLPGLVPPLRPYRTSTFALQAVLTYLPFAMYGRTWHGAPGLLAASALLVLPSWCSWPAFGVTAAGTELIRYALGCGTGDVIREGAWTVVTALALYSLSRLTGLAGEIDAARAEAARLAVRQEHLRFSRDLHDLLGHSLSAITFKCELICRLLDGSPATARAELAEVLQISRQSLADVRTVAGGYRKVSLNTEVASARSMLTAMGVRTSGRSTCMRLPDAVDRTLAIVVREGLTNMIRHSKIARCEINTRLDGGWVEVSLVNDGAERPAPGRPAGSGGGCGIANLTERVEALGGVLTARMRADRRFELRARVPLAPHAEAPYEERPAAMA